MGEPEMPGWDKTSVGALCKGIYDGPHATPKKTDAGPIFLGISNLSNGRLDLSDTAHLSEADFVKWTRRVTPQPGDVVFSYETRLGEAALIPQGLRCCLGRRMGLLRPDRTKVDPRFLLYLWLSPAFQRTIASRAVHGSTVDRTLLTELPEYPVEVPDLPEQRRIAHILGTLDDKIELNRRMNRTLEAIARAIFKSWFVDFDPVHAKAEGREPVGMDPETAALFPDSFQDSPLGKIPKGWEIATLGECAELLDHKRIPLNARERSERQGPYPYYGAAGIMDHVDNYLFEGVHLLVGEDGSVVTERGHPVLQYVWGKFWVNNHAHVLVGLAPVSTDFLFLALGRTYIRPYVTGAVQPKLNQGNLKRVPFVLPTGPLLAEFDAAVECLFGTKRHTADQCEPLAQTRDVLLPQLLSGEMCALGEPQNGD
jgi:type I restriction enzyme S subunit